MGNDSLWGATLPHNEFHPIIFDEQQVELVLVMGNPWVTQPLPTPIPALMGMGTAMCGWQVWQVFLSLFYMSPVLYLPVSALR